MKPDIIMLAAGASTRMGTPKQLLTYQGQPLLRVMCEVALKSNLGRVVVVLGANEQRVKPEIENLPLDIVHNTEWETGMAGSIQCGLQKILEINPQSESVIFLLTDQPYLSVSLLERMAEDARLHSTHTIIATEYADTIGVPALFKRALFHSLQSLTGQEGAKKVIIQNRDRVFSIPFPAGSIDLDTPADYQHFLDSLSASRLEVL
jgi:molybdenum cofactor cytidylyltransferase